MNNTHDQFSKDKDFSSIEENEVMKSNKKRKVKDIFAPHELKSGDFVKITEEPVEIQEEPEINIEMEEQSIRIVHTETVPQAREDVHKSLENFFRETEEELPELRTRTISKPPLRAKKGDFKLFWFISIPIALLAFYYFGFVVLARAEIGIETYKKEIPFSKEIVVDDNVSSIDVAKAVIPGNLFVFNSTERQEFESTGQGKDEIKAKGIITIYNNYSTDPQILVATTRFETPDHKIFRLDSRVVIPGATTENGKLVPSTIDVKVTADKAGPDYNIEACKMPDCKYTIPGFEGMPEFDGFYGVSNNSMTGGSLGSVPMVSSEDIKKAEEEILTKIMETINVDIENKITNEYDNLVILPGAKSGVKVSKIESDAKIGDYKDKFTVNAEVEIKVIAYDKNHLLNYIQSVLKESKEKDYDFCKDLEIEYSDLEADFDKGFLQLTVKTSQTLCQKLDVEAIKKDILGKNEKELDAVFKANPGIEEVKIKFWPFWIKRTPKSLQKVKILIDGNVIE